MKKILVRVLKVVVPLALGAWLVVYFYRQLAPEQRDQLFAAMREADLRWLWGAMILGLFSHMSRAYRWRFLLAPMGHRPGFWNCYHAVMIGYFMNMLLPRAGEASRAVSLYRTDGVPFEKAFGSILAERAVDFLLLLGIAGCTILLQFDKLDLFKARIDSFRREQGPDEGGATWIWWAVAIAAIAMCVGAYVLFTRPVLRARLMDTIRGFGEGLRSVTRTERPWTFIFHTLLIWTLYVLMFWVGFFALPATAEVPPAGIFAGFIAGSVGIILVQGGIGAYPAFVALIVSIYMAAPEGGGLIRPDALAMGWLLWAAQTILVVVLGGVSLLLAGRERQTA